MLWFDDRDVGPSTTPRLCAPILHQRPSRFLFCLVLTFLIAPPLCLFVYAGTLFYQTFNSTMPVTYMKNLGYNATGLGSREFDGGASMFQSLIQGYNPSPYDSYYVPTPLSFNLNTSQAGSGYSPILKMKTFSIGGMDISVGAIVNLKTSSLTKLPAGIDVYTAGNTSAAITQNLASKKIVILLSKQSTLEDERAFIDSYGLSAFIDIIISSNNGEAMTGSSGCATGFSCDHHYPLNLTNAEGNTYLYALPPPLGTGIGVLNVTFDANGILTNFEGDSVIFNRTKYLPDPLVEKDIYDRQQIVTQQTGKVITEVPTFLVGDGSGDVAPCRNKQCSMGSLVADAMRNYSGASFAFIGGGSLRANISAGTFPFGSRPKIAHFRVVVWKPRRPQNSFRTLLPSIALFSDEYIV